jgi:hypothetical protein
MVRRILLGVLAVLIVLGVWIAIDLNDRSRHTLRDFDPHEVARLETRMWRSYYEHRSLRLFSDLVKLLREQYHLPFWQGTLGAYHAARAAVVFQRGHERPDYLLALPDLISYYTLIDAASLEPLRVPEVSASELEWWIVHRQRTQHPAGDLARALAVEQAGIFHQAVDDFSDHARARAEAMDLCDAGNAHGGASDAAWAQIQNVLDRSWSTLYTVVNR